jgi:hypothetical protein
MVHQATMGLTWARAQGLPAPFSRASTTSLVALATATANRRAPGLKSDVIAHHAALREIAETLRHGRPPWAGPRRLALATNRRRARNPAA